MIMGGIKVGRWLAGGIAAGLLIWVLEGAGSVLFMEEAQTALEAHNLSLDLTPGFMAMTVLVSLLTGLVLVFFYAAARPRFGPGPRTAVIVGVVTWLAGYFLSLVGYGMIGLYATGLLVKWGVVGLVELILGALLGGRIYRED
jgi:hypothetical protein